MNTDRQIFWDNFTARGAYLRSAARIDLYHCSASLFRFARTETYKLIPRGICNTLVHAVKVTLLHRLNTQFLKGNELIFVYKFTRQLVCKVGTPISNAMMNMLNGTATFFSLCPCKRLFILAKESRVVNLLSVRKCSKVGKPNVNASNLLGNWQWGRFYDARKASVPMTERVAPNGKCFRRSFQREVKFDFDNTDFGKAQVPTVNELPRAIILWISERVISVSGLKTRVARLFARLDAAEECAKGKINTGLGILQGLRVCFFQPGVFLFPYWEQFVGVISADGFFTFLPGIASSFKCFVINPTASLQHLLHSRLLRFCWVQPIPESLSHVGIISRTVRNVKFAYSAGMSYCKLVYWMWLQQMCPK